MRITSKLSPDQLLSRLSGRVGRYSMIRPMKQVDHPILGRVRENRILLCVWKAYNNSFSPFFVGAVHRIENGSVVEGGFRFHILMRVIMCVVFSVMGFGIIKALLGYDTELMPYVGPAAFIFGMLGLCKFLARHEKGKMVRFLEENATP